MGAGVAAITGAAANAGAAAGVQQDDAALRLKSRPENS